MSDISKRDETLIELSRQLDKIKKQEHALLREMQDAERSVARVQQDLEHHEQSFEESRAADFDPNHHDQDLEELLEYTVRGHEIREELQQAESRLRKRQERLEGLKTQQKDVINRVRATYTEHGWSRD